MPPTVIPEEEFGACPHEIDRSIQVFAYWHTSVCLLTGIVNCPAEYVDTDNLTGGATPLSSPTPSTGTGAGNPLNNTRDEPLFDIPEMHMDVDGGNVHDLGISFPGSFPAEQASSNATREEDGFENSTSSLYQMLFLYKDNGVNGLGE